MKIEFNDKGAVATVTITSTVFEFSRHNRAVETALFLAPGTIASRCGFFLMKTVISGPTARVIRAYKNAMREAAR